jgi:uncharacterized RDD family membrane protein YckC
MLCPSCQKSQPLAFRCGSCGAQMMQATYQTTTGPPLMDEVLTPIPVISDNPYNAPRPGPSAPAPSSLLRTTPTEVLASRSSRLAALVIDYVCLIAVSIPGLAGFLVMESTGTTSANMDFVSLAFVLGLGALGATQAFYIVRDGQTIGKKLMKIRIVNDMDSQVPTWPRLLLMRYGLNMALRQIPFYYFVDAFFIFGEQQRCLHDFIAGTKVIEV